jgi:HPt (histidine-containing phosphotransfer) domain-containing protein
MSTTPVSPHLGTTDTPATLLIDEERVLEVIDLICEGEPAALERWIAYLEADITKLENLLPCTNSKESLAALYDVSHALKGTCANMGAQALGALFIALEKDAKAGNAAALNQRYADGKMLGSQSIQALREFMAKLKAGTRAG